jgi:hypothetical protein
MLGFLLGPRYGVNLRLEMPLPSLPVILAFLAATLALNFTPGSKQSSRTKPIVMSLAGSEAQAHGSPFASTTA